MHFIYLFLRRILHVAGVMAVVVQGAVADEGGISLGRTRIIFLSTDNAQTLTIQNHGSRPYLVQSAVVATQEGHEPAPFITTPPLFRLEDNSKNTLRILPKGDSKLPADRESVFYFTAVAVPAMTQTKEADDTALAARVSVGIKNTIKLFYRPAGLAMTSEEAAGGLTFHLQGGKMRVDNPTPYYLTFSRLAFDGTEVKVRDTVSMIAPFSQVSYPVTGQVRQAKWAVINDYGGSSPQYTSTVLSGAK